MFIRRPSTFGPRPQDLYWSYQLLKGDKLFIADPKNLYRKPSENRMVFMVKIWGLRKNSNDDDFFPNWHYSVVFILTNKCITISLLISVWLILYKCTSFDLIKISFLQKKRIKKELEIPQFYQIKHFLEFFP